MDLHDQCFGFEAEFSGDLRCIPMAVRRKLDLAGVKLKLVHWHGLEAEERQRLLSWGDDGAAIEALRDWLLERSTRLPQGPARPLPPARGCDWQQSERIPALLAESCRQLGLVLRPGGWSDLNELQRFALLKLSHPGHEHRNLGIALQEFGLLAAGGDPGD